MRMTRSFAAIVGALVLIPALTLSAQSAPSSAAQKPKASAKAPAKAATHSTSGIVRSVDPTTLVVAKNAKDTTTETFVLNADTVKKGDLVEGAKVGVRYVTDGGRNVATAVTATAIKKAAKAKGKSFPKSSR